MRIIGIDPGFSGAWALVVDGRPMLVGDMPTAGEGARKRVSAPSLAEAIAIRLPDLVVVENVHAMPKQGVSSTFKFGVGFGTILGVVGALRIPIEFVEPSAWKRHFRFTAGSGKRASLQKATELAPHLASSLDRQRDHGRAEAVLIGLYAHSLFGSDAARLDASSNVGGDGSAAESASTPAAASDT